jgi:tetratricopeptide (TPR) repeat protein
MGIFDNQRGRFADARVNLLECLALMRQIGNPRTIALALGNLGLVAINQGDYAEAQPLLDEGLAIIRKSSDRATLPIILNRVSFALAHRGDFDRAQTGFDECLSVSRELKAQTIIPQSLIGLGSLAAAVGDFDRAREYLDEAITVGKTVGAWVHSAALLALGSNQSLQGDDEAARLTLQESVDLLEKLEEPWRRAQVYSKLGVVLVRLNETDAGWQMLYQVLADALQMGAYPLILDVLIGLAQGYLKTGHVADVVRSAQLVSLVASHPALSAVDTEPRLGALFYMCQARLSREAYAEAVAQGEMLDLNTTVAEILDETSHDR